MLIWKLHVYTAQSNLTIKDMIYGGVFTVEYPNSTSITEWCEFLRFFSSELLQLVVVSKQRIIDLKNGKVQVS